MWNLIRIIIYIWLLWSVWYWWYQKYYNLWTNKDTTIVTWSIASSGLLSDNTQVIEQLGIYLSWQQWQDNTQENPFWASYITITDQTPNANNTACTTPRGRSIPNDSYIIAYQSSNSNALNRCVLEKRMCQSGKLWWSYQYHTCYFAKPWGSYEYKGIVGSSSTQVITMADEPWIYIDDTIWVTNYQVIDAQHISPWYQWPTYNTVSWLEEYNTRDSVTIRPSNSVDGIQWRRINESPIKRTYSTNNRNIEPISPSEVRISCRSPWWTEVFHNQNIIAFRQSRVPSGGRCESELRICVQWYLKWSYQHETCTIDNNSSNNYWYYSLWWQWSHISQRNRWQSYNIWRSCTIGWKTINHRQSVRTYRQNRRWWTIYCESTIRWCVDWRTTWDPSFDRLSCSWSSTAACIHPQWGLIEHGQSIISYQSNSVWPYDTCRYERRTCSNGKLSWSYQYTSCTRARTY